MIPYFQHPILQTTPTNKNIKLHKLRIQSISQTTNVVELASHKFNISILTSIMKNHVHLQHLSICQFVEMHFVNDKRLFSFNTIVTLIVTIPMAKVHN